MAPSTYSSSSISSSGYSQSVSHQDLRESQRLGAKMVGRSISIGEPDDRAEGYIKRSVRTSNPLEMPPMCILEVNIPSAGLDKTGLVVVAVVDSELAQLEQSLSSAESAEQLIDRFNKGLENLKKSLSVAQSVKQIIDPFNKGITESEPFETKVLQELQQALKKELEKLQADNKSDEENGIKNTTIRSQIEKIQNIQLQLERCLHLKEGIKNWELRRNPIKQRIAGYNEYIMALGERSETVQNESPLLQQTRLLKEAFRLDEQIQLNFLDAKIAADLKLTGRAQKFYNEAVPKLEDLKAKCEQLDPMIGTIGDSLELSRQAEDFRLKAEIHRHWFPKFPGWVASDFYESKEAFKKSYKILQQAQERISQFSALTGVAARFLSAPDAKRIIHDSKIIRVSDLRNTGITDTSVAENVYTAVSALHPSSKSNEEKARDNAKNTNNTVNNNDVPKTHEMKVAEAEAIKSDALKEKIKSDRETLKKYERLFERAVKLSANEKFGIVNEKLKNTRAGLEGPEILIGKSSRIIQNIDLTIAEQSKGAAEDSVLTATLYKLYEELERTEKLMSAWEEPPPEKPDADKIKAESIEDQKLEPTSLSLTLQQNVDALDARLEALRAETDEEKESKDERMQAYKEALAVDKARRKIHAERMEAYEQIPEVREADKKLEEEFTEWQDSTSGLEEVKALAQLEAARREAAVSTKQPAERHSNALAARQSEQAKKEPQLTASVTKRLEDLEEIKYLKAVQDKQEFMLNLEDFWVAALAYPKLPDPNDYSTVDEPTIERKSEPLKLPDLLAQFDLPDLSDLNDSSTANEYTVERKVEQAFEIANQLPLHYAEPENLKANLNKLSGLIDGLLGSAEGCLNKVAANAPELLSKEEGVYQRAECYYHIENCIRIAELYERASVWCQLTKDPEDLKHNALFREVNTKFEEIKTKAWKTSLGLFKYLLPLRDYLDNKSDSDAPGDASAAGNGSTPVVGNSSSAPFNFSAVFIGSTAGLSNDQTDGENSNDEGVKVEPKTFAAKAVDLVKASAPRTKPAAPQNKGGENARMQQKLQKHKGFAEVNVNSAYQTALQILEEQRKQVENAEKQLKEVVFLELGEDVVEATRQYQDSIQALEKAVQQHASVEKPIFGEYQAAVREAREKGEILRLLNDLKLTRSQPGQSELAKKAAQLLQRVEKWEQADVKQQNELREGIRKILALKQKIIDFIEKEDNLIKQTSVVRSCRDDLDKLQIELKKAEAKIEEYDRNLASRQLEQSSLATEYKMWDEEYNKVTKLIEGLSSDKIAPSEISVKLSNCLEEFGKLQQKLASLNGKADQLDMKIDQQRNDRISELNNKIEDAIQQKLTALMQTVANIQPEDYKIKDDISASKLDASVNKIHQIYNQDIAPITSDLEAISSTLSTFSPTIKKEIEKCKQRIESLKKDLNDISQHNINVLNQSRSYVKQEIKNLSENLEEASEMANSESALEYDSAMAQFEAASQKHKKCVEGLEELIHQSEILSKKAGELGQLETTISTLGVVQAHAQLAVTHIEQIEQQNKFQLVAHQKLAGLKQQLSELHAGSQHNTLEEIEQAYVKMESDIHLTGNNLLSEHSDLLSSASKIIEEFKNLKAICREHKEAALQQKKLQHAKIAINNLLNSPLTPLGLAQGSPKKMVEEKNKQIEHEIERLAEVQADIEAQRIGAAISGDLARLEDRIAFLIDAKASNERDLNNELEKQMHKFKGELQRLEEQVNAVEALKLKNAPNAQWIRDQQTKIKGLVDQLQDQERQILDTGSRLAESGNPGIGKLSSQTGVLLRKLEAQNKSHQDDLAGKKAAVEQAYEEYAAVVNQAQQRVADVSIALESVKASADLLAVEQHNIDNDAGVAAATAVDADVKAWEVQVDVPTAADLRNQVKVAVQQKRAALTKLVQDEVNKWNDEWIRVTARPDVKPLHGDDITEVNVDLNKQRYTEKKALLEGLESRGARLLEAATVLAEDQKAQLNKQCEVLRTSSADLKRLMEADENALKWMKDEKYKRFSEEYADLNKKFHEKRRYEAVDIADPDRIQDKAAEYTDLEQGIETCERLLKDLEPVNKDQAIKSTVELKALQQSIAKEKKAYLARIEEQREEVQAEIRKKLKYVLDAIEPDAYALNGTVTLAEDRKQQQAIEKVSVQLHLDAEPLNGREQNAAIQPEVTAAVDRKLQALNKVRDENAKKLSAALESAREEYSKQFDALRQQVSEISSHLGEREVKNKSAVDANIRQISALKDKIESTLLNHTLKLNELRAEDQLEISILDNSANELVNKLQQWDQQIQSNYEAAKSGLSERMKTAANNLEKINPDDFKIVARALNKAQLLEKEAAIEAAHAKLTELRQTSSTLQREADELGVTFSDKLAAGNIERLTAELNVVQQANFDLLTAEVKTIQEESNQKTLELEKSFNQFMQLGIPMTAEKLKELEENAQSLGSEIAAARRFQDQLLEKLEQVGGNATPFVPAAVILITANKEELNKLEGPIQEQLHKARQNLRDKRHALAQALEWEENSLQSLEDQLTDLSVSGEDDKDTEEKNKKIEAALKALEAIDIKLSQLNEEAKTLEHLNLKAEKLLADASEVSKKLEAQKSDNQDNRTRHLVKLQSIAHIKENIKTLLERNTEKFFLEAENISIEKVQDSEKEIDAEIETLKREHVVLKEKSITVGGQEQVQDDLTQLLNKVKLLEATKKQNQERLDNVLAQQKEREQKFDELEKNAKEILENPIPQGDSGFEVRRVELGNLIRAVEAEITNPNKAAEEGKFRLNLKDTPSLHKRYFDILMSLSFEEKNIIIAQNIYQSMRLVLSIKSEKYKIASFNRAYEVKKNQDEIQGQVEMVRSIAEFLEESENDIKDRDNETENSEKSIAKYNVYIEESKVYSDSLVQELLDIYASNAKQFAEAQNALSIEIKGLEDKLKRAFTEATQAIQKTRLGPSGFIEKFESENQEHNIRIENLEQLIQKGESVFKKAIPLEGGTALLLHDISRAKSAISKLQAIIKQNTDRIAEKEQAHSQYLDKMREFESEVQKATATVEHQQLSEVEQKLEVIMGLEQLLGQQFSSEANKLFALSGEDWASLETTGQRLKDQLNPYKAALHQAKAKIKADEASLDNNLDRAKADLLSLKNELGDFSASVDEAQQVEDKENRIQAMVSQFNAITRNLSVYKGLAAKLKHQVEAVEALSNEAKELGVHIEQNRANLAREKADLQRDIQEWNQQYLALKEQVAKVMQAPSSAASTPADNGGDGQDIASRLKEAAACLNEVEQNLRELRRLEPRARKLPLLPVPSHTVWIEGFNRLTEALIHDEVEYARNRLKAMAQQRGPQPTDTVSELQQFRIQARQYAEDLQALESRMRVVQSSFPAGNLNNPPQAAEFLAIPDEIATEKQRQAHLQSVCEAELKKHAERLESDAQVQVKHLQSLKHQIDAIALAAAGGLTTPPQDWSQRFFEIGQRVKASENEAEEFKGEEFKSVYASVGILSDAKEQLMRSIARLHEGAVSLMKSTINSAQTEYSSTAQFGKTVAAALNVERPADDLLNFQQAFSEIQQKIGPVSTALVEWRPFLEACEQASLVSAVQYTMMKGKIEAVQSQCVALQREMQLDDQLIKNLLGMRRGWLACKREKEAISAELAKRLENLRPYQKTLEAFIQEWDPVALPAASESHNPFAALLVKAKKELADVKHDIDKLQKELGVLGNQLQIAKKAYHKLKEEFDQEKTGGQSPDLMTPGAPPSGNANLSEPGQENSVIDQKLKELEHAFVPYQQAYSHYIKHVASQKDLLEFDTDLSELDQLKLQRKKEVYQHWLARLKYKLKPNVRNDYGAVNTVKEELRQAYEAYRVLLDGAELEALKQEYNTVCRNIDLTFEFGQALNELVELNEGMEKEKNQHAKLTGIPDLSKSRLMIHQLPQETEDSLHQAWDTYLEAANAIIKRLEVLKNDIVKLAPDRLKMLQEAEDKKRALEADVLKLLYGAVLKAKKLAETVQLHAKLEEKGSKMVGDKEFLLIMDRELLLVNLADPAGTSEARQNSFFTVMEPKKRSALEAKRPESKEQFSAWDENAKIFLRKMLIDTLVQRQLDWQHTNGEHNSEWNRDSIQNRIESVFKEPLTIDGKKRSIDSFFEARGDRITPSLYKTVFKEADRRLGWNGSKYQKESSVKFLASLMKRGSTTRKVGKPSSKDAKKGGR